MKNFIIGLLLGAVAGGAGVYLFDKRRYTRSFNDALEKALNEEVARVEDYYREKEEELMAAEVNHTKGKIKDKPTVKEIVEEKANEILKDYRTADDSYDRAELEGPSEDDIIGATGLTEEELNALIADAEAKEKIQAKLEEMHPKTKIITQEHFGEIEDYECETLRFFIEDKMLVHENNELVEDPEFLLDDALDRYGWADDDKDANSLFVRNYKLQRDYEVMKVYDEWYGNE
jgi:gas vesicle protein